MSTLHTSPSRLALLRDVDAGHVWSTAGAAFNGASGQTRRVNDAIQAMRREGWVEAQYGKWRLTDKGRALLAEHAEPRTAAGHPAHTPGDSQ